MRAGLVKCANAGVAYSSGPLISTGIEETLYAIQEFAGGATSSASGQPGVLAGGEKADFSETVSDVTAH